MYALCCTYYTFYDINGSNQYLYLFIMIQPDVKEVYPCIYLQIIQLISFWSVFTKKENATEKLWVLKQLNRGLVFVTGKGCVHRSHSLTSGVTARAQRTVRRILPAAINLWFNTAHYVLSDDCTIKLLLLV